MPLYEVLLQRDDDDELRLTDQPLQIGETVTIAGQRWLVQHDETPEGSGAEIRYVCVPAE